MIQLKKPYVTTLPYTDDMRKLPVLINGDTAILFLEPINIDGDKVETLINNECRDLGIKKIGQGGSIGFSGTRRGRFQIFSH